MEDNAAGVTPISPRLRLRKSGKQIPLEYAEKPLLQQAKSLLKDSRER